MRFHVAMSHTTTTTYELDADSPEDAVVLAQRCAKDGPMGIHLTIIRLATTFAYTTETTMLPATTDG